MITRWTRVRLWLCAVAFVALAVPIVIRAYRLQVEQHGELVNKAQNQYLRDILLPPQRGRILDRDGHELATMGEVDSLACNPRLLNGIPGAVEKLAKAVGRDPRDLRAAFYDKKGEQRYFTWVKRWWTTPKEIEAALGLGLPGVRVEKEPKRVYPWGQLGSTVIGHATVDGIGVEGIENDYDKYLRGTAVQVRGMRDNLRRSLLVNGPGDRISTVGKDLVLTLDQHLMFVTEKALRGAMEKWQAVSATAVVMDPRNGEILALVSLPGYDPNRPGDAVGEGRAKNHAITDIYEPGSTMKAVTLAAALDAGKVKPTTWFDCQNGKPLYFGKKPIGDDHPEGVLMAAEVFQRSSNIGTIKIANTLGKSAFYESLRKFGFGQRTGLGLRGEVRGLLPPSNKWGDVHFATISFGHGISVTPLQITAAYAAIASGGIYRSPRLVLKAIHPDGREELVPPSASAREERILKPQTARTMLKIMELVTQEKSSPGIVDGVEGHPKGGTARVAAIPGYAVGGKTGTANKNANGRYINKYVASFVGVVPLDDPRLVITVIVDEPEPMHKGGIVAAPVFKEIAEAALKYLAIPARPDLLAKSKEPADKTGLPAMVAESHEGPVLDTPVWTDIEAEIEDDGDEAEGEDGLAPVEELADVPPPVDMVQVPSFAGLSLGEAIRVARRVGVEIAADGSGVAVAQSPAPGPLPRGSLLRVTFRPGT